MYMYCSKPLINMAVSITGRILLDVSDGQLSRLEGRLTASPQVCNISGEPHQFMNRTVKTVKSRD
jgi:hypothetical protein